MSASRPSRAALPKLRGYAARMGWSFPLPSCEGSSFNYDFAVSFTDEQRRSGELVYNFDTQAVKSSDMPGFSVFAKDEAGRVFHTYSTRARGIEPMNPTYYALDLVPKGATKQQARWRGYVAATSTIGS